MLLSPTQLRSLRVEALNWSSGVMCDELGWTGKNATTRLTDMEQDREPINLPTSKHAVRIAREHGFELVNGAWEIAWDEITPDKLKPSTTHNGRA